MSYKAYTLVSGATALLLAGCSMRASRGELGDGGAALSDTRTVLLGLSRDGALLEGETDAGELLEYFEDASESDGETDAGELLEDASLEGDPDAGELLEDASLEGDPDAGELLEDASPEGDAAPDAMTPELGPVCEPCESDAECGDGLRCLGPDGRDEQCFPGSPCMNLRRCMVDAAPGACSDVFGSDHHYYDQTDTCAPYPAYRCTEPGPDCQPASWATWCELWLMDSL